jgi:hypothetical protein
MSTQLLFGSRLLTMLPWRHAVGRFAMPTVSTPGHHAGCLPTSSVAGYTLLHSSAQLNSHIQYCHSPPLHPRPWLIYHAPSSPGPTLARRSHTPCSGVRARRQNHPLRHGSSSRAISRLGRAAAIADE